jgi:hypothetical protein
MPNLTLGANTLIWNNFTETLTLPSVNTQTSLSTFVVILSTTGTFTGISDTVGGVATGNIYNQIGTSETFGFGGKTLTAYACVNGAGGNTHVVTVNTSSFGTGQAFFCEIEGFAGNHAVLDNFAMPTNGDTAIGTSIPSPTAVASSADAFLLAAIMATQDGTTSSGDTVTDTAGWNNILQSFTDGTGTTSAYPGAMSALVNQAAGSYNDTFLYGSTTNTHNWAAFTMAFKAQGLPSSTATLAWIK